MGNHTKPVVDKENITDEERKRLLNRDKCRKYRNKHREHYREYQRAYKEKTYSTLPAVIARLKEKIARNKRNIKKYEQELEALIKLHNEQKSQSTIHVVSANNPFNI